MSDKIVRFPSSAWERVANKRGKYSVSCIISDRWLLFEQEAHKTDHGTAVFVDVMTGMGEETRKLSRMCVTLEQLRKVVKNYE